LHDPTVDTDYFAVLLYHFSFAPRGTQVATEVPTGSRSLCATSADYVVLWRKCDSDLPLFAPPKTWLNEAMHRLGERGRRRSPSFLAVDLPVGVTARGFESRRSRCFPAAKPLASTSQR
jgi:hypothetical protein